MQYISITIKYVGIFLLVLILKYVIRTKIRGSFIKYICRNSLVYLPYLTILVLCGVNTDYFRVEYNKCINMYICVILLILVSDRNTRLCLNKNIMRLFPKTNLRNNVSVAIGVLGSAVFEELFYRYFYLIYPSIANMFVTSILFSLSHSFENNLKNRYKAMNYVRLFLLGIFLNVIIKYEKNLFIVIVLHFLYDCPFLISQLVRYDKSLTSKWE